MLFECGLGKFGACPVRKSINRRRKEDLRYRLNLWKRSVRVYRSRLEAQEDADMSRTGTPEAIAKYSAGVQLDRPLYEELKQRVEHPRSVGYLPDADPGGRARVKANEGRSYASVTPGESRNSGAGKNVIPGRLRPLRPNQKERSPKAPPLSSTQAHQAQEPRHKDRELLPSASLAGALLTAAVLTAAVLTAAVLTAAVLTTTVLTAALRPLLGFLSGRIPSIIGPGPFSQRGGHRLCHSTSLHQTIFLDSLAGVPRTT